MLLRAFASSYASNEIFSHEAAKTRRTEESTRCTGFLTPGFGSLGRLKSVRSRGLFEPPRLSRSFALPMGLLFNELDLDGIGGKKNGYLERS